MDKDYRKHPFRDGDEVYHPIHGKVKLKFISDEDSPFPVIQLLLGEVELCTLKYSDILVLSFTPYNLNADWRRPVQLKNGDYFKFVDSYDENTGEPIFVEGIFNGTNKKKDKILFYALEQDGEVEYRSWISGPSNLYPSDGKSITEKMKLDNNRWNKKTLSFEAYFSPNDIVVVYNDDAPENAIMLRYESLGVPFDNIIKAESIEDLKNVLFKKTLNHE